jgi:hypothetical protein
LNQSRNAGAIEMRGAGHTRTMMNSTIAGNVADYTAGVFASGSDLQIDNSTIAFNRLNPDSSGSGVGSGLFSDGIEVVLNSTLLAMNGDLATPTFSDVDGVGALSGGHNLIYRSSLAVPIGTIENTEPMLNLLFGDMRAVAELDSQSPAINAGSNTALLSFDQRGTGYPRTIGSATDIGSFEFNPGDQIFADGFN